jgi:putative endonuclease
MINEQLSFRGRRGFIATEPGIGLSLLFASIRIGLDRAIIATMISERPVREPAVYMLATKPYGTLYIGVTSDLVKRIWEHRSNATDGFTKRYGIHRLVHFEQFRSMVEAIEREKELKKWRRAWKIALVDEANPDWRDLWLELNQ